MATSIPFLRTVAAALGYQHEVVRLSEAVGNCSRLRSAQIWEYLMDFTIGSRNG